MHGWNARQLAELRSHKDFVELVVRSGMVDKMAVLKEFPQAEWHCALWDEVVHATQKTHTDEKVAAQKLLDFQEEVRVARARLQAIHDGEEEVRRQQILKERREAREKMRAEADAAREALLADCAVAKESTERASMAFVTTTSMRARGGPATRGGGPPPASLLGLDSKSFKELEASLTKTRK